MILASHHFGLAHFDDRSGEGIWSVRGEAVRLSYHMFGTRTLTSPMYFEHCTGPWRWTNPSNPSDTPPSTLSATLKPSPSTSPSPTSSPGS